MCFDGLIKKVLFVLFVCFGFIWLELVVLGQMTSHDTQERMQSYTHLNKMSFLVFRNVDVQDVAIYETNIFHYLDIQTSTEYNYMVCLRISHMFSNQTNQIQLLLANNYTQILQYIADYRIPIFLCHHPLVFCGLDTQYICES